MSSGANVVPCHTKDYYWNSPEVHVKIILVYFNIMVKINAMDLI